MRLYFAAPLGFAGRTHDVALAVATLGGHAIVSRWHATQHPGGDPSDDADRARILGANLEDLERADVLVALLDEGTPRATLVELGWALGRGKPVVWVHGEDGTGRNVTDVYPSVTRCLAGPRVAVRICHALASIAARATTTTEPA